MLRRRRRLPLLLSLPLRLLYLVLVVGLAAWLYCRTPADVKRAMYETSIAPPDESADR